MSSQPICAKVSTKKSREIEKRGRIAEQKHTCSYFWFCVLHQTYFEISNHKRWLLFFLAHVSFLNLWFFLEKQAFYLESMCSFLTKYFVRPFKFLTTCFWNQSNFQKKLYLLNFGQEPLHLGDFSQTRTWTRTQSDICNDMIRDM